MTSDVYRYRFEPDLALEDVEATLSLAIIAVEGLHGESQTLLDLRHTFDPTTRTCVIDASCPVGQDLNRLVTGFLRREFGTDGFRVERLAQTDELRHGE
jgi:hypothetical protein